MPRSRPTDPAPAAPSPASTQARAPRADARRNVAAILDAAQDLLTDDADATMTQIAQSAGVGRVTLYGHFATRTELVDAVFDRVVDQADAVLDSVDTRGDPAEALTRLIAASWPTVHSFRSVLAAAERELGPERVHRHHDRHLRRVAALIGRGQRAGVFRSDLPQQWLVATAYSLMHTAAHECSAGRLTAAEAERAVTRTVLAAVSTPGRPAG